MQVLLTSKEKEAISSARILIVDADSYLRGTVRQQLAVEGFSHVFEADIVAHFDTTLKNANPDLILLDIEISDGNAIEICRSLRGGGFAKPIIMLTTKGSEDDTILALEAGANDYIAKPLRMGELLARIHVQLRQSFVLGDVQFEIGDLIFTPANKTLHEISTKKVQKLTEKEATILKFLYQAFPGEVTKSQILCEVWGFQNGLSTHTLETHIYRLRQKINRFNKTQLVLTTEKGYRLAD
ncbi:response regulator transcription factor [Candidatus Puniceispirillum sp.]|nr:response regulator transcription factor [Candidatus Puniceispirillum sp.]